MAVVAGVSLALSDALSATATSEPPTASAASVGDEIEPPSLDSCEEGELDPIEPSQPPESEASEESDESGGPAASAASLGDEMPPPDEDSCEDGELEPIELPEPDEELDGPAASAASLGDETELLSEGPHPPGSAIAIAGATVPAAKAAATIAATERRR